MKVEIMVAAAVQCTRRTTHGRVSALALQPILLDRVLVIAIEIA